jgi:hypothetical protein
MPTIHVELDTKSFNRLAESAIEECRPIPWQAEVLLRRALGLPAPSPSPLSFVPREAEELQGEHP